MTATSNSNITKAFFALTDVKVKNDVLGNIATHYGITRAEALAEVTGDEAESLLDYLTGSVRTATHVLMKRHQLVE